MANIRKTGKATSFVLSILMSGLVSGLISSAVFSPVTVQAGFSLDLKSCISSLGSTILGISANSKKTVFGSIAVIASVLVVYKLTKYVNNHESKLKFDFGKINFGPKDLKFENKNLGQDEKFLWGVATSAYQVEGNGGQTVTPSTQWERCEGSDIEINGKMCKPVPEISGKGCDHWTLYKRDIDLAKKLGFNTFRISISWDKVEPECGKFNQEALQHYQDVCKYMVDNGIKPVITLHHYADPCWFADMGGFEKTENIKYFVEFCETVFKRLNKYKPIWFTFNTFSGYAMCAYQQGTKPPFKKDMVLAIEVFKNLLESHVRVYRALKKIDQDSTIGIYKVIHQIDPWNLLNPLDILFSYMGEYMINDAVYNFFKTGVYKVWVPFKVNMNYENKDAIGALDCIGLNYYSGKFAKNCNFIKRPGCMLTQNKEHCVYPEGFYRALIAVDKNLAKPLNVPIYVTENGIAALCDQDRETFYKQYLYAMSRAMQEGVDVRGYITWTLMDNYEWGHWDIKYGLCSVDPVTLERKLKPGTEFLLEVVKNN